MEKKKSVGVITISIVDFILAFGLLFMFFTFGKGSFVENIRSNLRHPLSPFLYGFIFALPVFIAGVSTMKLRRLGRRLNIYIFVLGIILSLIQCSNGMPYLTQSPLLFLDGFMQLVFSVVVIVFLTRTKVKEQFK